MQVILWHNEAQIVSSFPKAPTNLAGLLEIEVYFNYLDRIGLLKVVFF